MNEMNYKGYSAAVSFSAEDRLLIGQIQHIEALIMFSAESIKELEAEFHAAVDSYVEDCKVSNVQPEKPYKGSYNVRIGPENHRRAAALAKKLGMSLNDLTSLSVEQFIAACNGQETITIAHQEVRAPSQVIYGYVATQTASVKVVPEYPYGPH